MKRLNGYRIRFMLVGFVAAIVLGGNGSASADFRFGEPTNLGLPINTSSNEATFCLSADSLEMYSSSNRPGTYGMLDIWVSARATINDNWTEPVNLGPVVNSSFPDAAEYISPDGLELYFDALNRPGGKGGWDIWMTKRNDANEPWGTPVNMGVTFNTSSDDWRACISPDNLKFYIVSTRPDGHGGSDIWVAGRTTTEEPWAEPVNLGSPVNGSADDSGPTISRDGLAFFFQSTRSGGYGGFDLWMTMCRTTDDDCNTPVNLGATVNTASDEILPAVSADGSVLYFSSPRPGGQGAWDIYQVSIDPIVDFNGDGNIDLDDLVMLIENWNTNESLYDIGPMPWGDGVVDREDLEVLMGYWGQEIDDPTLIAYWALDETQGNIAQDSANEHHGTLHGEPLWQPESGMVAGALQLDGLESYISTPFVLDPADGAFSAFAWIKDGAPGQVIVSQTDGVDWLMADPSAGRLMTTLQKPRGRAPVPPLISEASITDGQWHRVGLVWDGTDRILYVDDLEVARDTQAAPESSTSGLYIGCGKELEAGTFFSGLIDDVRIHNRAATP